MGGKHRIVAVKIRLDKEKGYTYVIAEPVLEEYEELEEPDIGLDQIFKEREDAISAGIEYLKKKGVEEKDVLVVQKNYL